MGDLRQSFHKELDDIKAEVIELTRITREAVGRATEIITTSNLDGARKLIEEEHEFEARAVALEDHCYQVLALQAPVASDLRKVVALVRIIAEVQRAFGLTVNICKASRRMHGHAIDPVLCDLMEKMGAEAQVLFGTAAHSIESEDAIEAAGIDDLDSELDGLQKQFVQEILESHARGGIDVQVAIQLATVARFFERIGDHAVNFGERVNYMVTGWLPEHKGAARFRARTSGE